MPRLKWSEGFHFPNLTGETPTHKLWLTEKNWRWLQLQKKESSLTHWDNFGGNPSTDSTAHIAFFCGERFWHQNLGTTTSAVCKPNFHREWDFPVGEWSFHDFKNILKCRCRRKSGWFCQDTVGLAGCTSIVGPCQVQCCNFLPFGSVGYLILAPEKKDRPSPATSSCYLSPGLSDMSPVACFTSHFSWLPSSRII